MDPEKKWHGSIETEMKKYLIVAFSARFFFLGGGGR